MAKNDNLKDFVTDIADAIREKKGTTDLINPQNFSDEIRNIETGGDIIDVDTLPTEDIDNDKIYKLTTPKGMFAYIDTENEQFIDLQIPNYIYVSSIDDVTEPMLSEVGTANSYIYVDTSSFIGYIFLSETERKTLSQFYNEFAGMDFVDRGKVETTEDAVESGVYFIPQGEETIIGVPDINYDKGLYKYNGFNWEYLGLNKYDVAGKWQEISSGNIYEFKIDGGILVNDEYNYLADNYKIIDNKVYIFDMDGNQSEPLLYIKSENSTNLARLDNKNFIYNKIEDFKVDEKTLDYDQASGIWYTSSLDGNGRVESIMYYVLPLLQDGNGKRNVKVYSADSEGFYDSSTEGMTYHIDGNQIKLQFESEGEVNEAGAFDYEVVDNKVHLTMDGEIAFTKIVTGLGTNDNGQFVSNYIPQNGLYNGVTINDPEALFFNAVVDVQGSSGGGTDMLQQRVDTNNSCQYLFFGYSGDNVDYITNLDTSKVTSMSDMFSNCTELTTIPQLDTSNILIMSNMFKSCTNLTTIPQLDTGKVCNMSGMFNSCTNLTTIPQLDTSKVTSMFSMFNSCTNLTTIPQLDTSSVTGMSSMFNGCTNLTTIPQLDTSKVTSMSSMFNGCTNLTTITQLDTSSIISISSMFNGCTNLTNLTLKNIKRSITIGSGTTYGHLLTVDSLINTIKELWARTSGSYKLTMGSTNTAKLADVYVRLIDVTDEMIAQDPNIESKMPCEVCESTDEGAMLITTYANNKGWTIA